MKFDEKVICEYFDITRKEVRDILAAGFDFASVITTPSSYMSDRFDRGIKVEYFIVKPNAVKNPSTTHTDMGFEQVDVTRHVISLIRLLRIPDINKDVGTDGLIKPTTKPV